MGQNKTIEETLKERGAVYGDYEGSSELRASIMDTITDRHEKVTSKPMSKLYQIYIFDIVNKLSRLSTTPDHLDTWHDIAGYAKLVEDTLTPKVPKTKSERNK